MCVGPACRSAHRVRSLELQPERAAGGPSAAADQQPDPEPAEPGADAAEHGAEPPAPRLLLPRPYRDGAPQYQPADGARPGDRLRSEEHTSELQSLMRISYAVFCLKKKNNIKTNTHPQRTTSSKAQRKNRRRKQHKQ